MALWFSLAVNGLDAYRDAVVAGNTMAKYAADQIKARPELELIREPDLSVVLFRREGWNAQNYYKWSTQFQLECPQWRGEKGGSAKKKKAFVPGGSIVALSKQQSLILSHRFENRPMFN